MRPSIGFSFAGLLMSGSVVLAAVLPAATVEVIDGSKLEGDLIWKATAVTVAGKEIALADCLRIGSGQAAAAEPGPLGLWLNDGGWLPTTAIAAAGADRLRVTGPFGTIDLPLSTCSAWGVEAPAGDPKRDAVLLAGGLVEGRLEGLADGHLLLRTDLDPEPLRLALTEVLACRLAGAVRPAKGLHLAAAWRDDRPATVLLPGAQGPTLAGTAIPLDQLPALTVEGGRVVYLSSLTPGAVEQRGAFGTVWPWQRDAGIDGDPLATGGRRFHRGIAVHSEARIAWTLAGRYERFLATAGISDLVVPEGDCIARLIGDGKELWQARLTGRTGAVALDLPLAGVRELVLQVDLGDRYDIGDHVVLGDARLIAVAKP